MNPLTDLAIFHTLMALASAPLMNGMTAVLFLAAITYTWLAVWFDRLEQKDLI